jgi:hypothetical protein
LRRGSTEENDVRQGWRVCPRVRRGFSQPVLKVAGHRGSLSKAYSSSNWGWLCSDEKSPAQVPDHDVVTKTPAGHQIEVVVGPGTRTSVSLSGIAVTLSPTGADGKGVPPLRRRGDPLGLLG